MVCSANVFIFLAMEWIRTHGNKHKNILATVDLRLVKKNFHSTNFSIKVVSCTLKSISCVIWCSVNMYIIFVHVCRLTDELLDTCADILPCIFLCVDTPLATSSLLRDEI